MCMRVYSETATAVCCIWQEAEAEAVTAERQL